MNGAAYVGALQSCRPFSGALVPTVYYRKVSQVWSLMIEVKRSLYMHEKTGECHDGFTAFRALLQEILRSLIRQVAVDEHTPPSSRW